MDNKKLGIVMLFGLLFKILLNNNMIANLNKMGMPPFYGPILSTIIGLLITIVLSIIILRKDHKIDFSKSFNSIIGIAVASLVTAVALSLMKIIVPVTSDNRIISLLVIILYFVVGTFIYIAYSIISGLINDVFEKKVFRKKIMWYNILKEESYEKIC